MKKILWSSSTFFLLFDSSENHADVPEVCVLHWWSSHGWMFQTSIHWGTVDHHGLPWVNRMISLNVRLIVIACDFLLSSSVISRSHIEEWLFFHGHSTIGLSSVLTSTAAISLSTINRIRPLPANVEGLRGKTQSHRLPLSIILQRGAVHLQQSALMAILSLRSSLERKIKGPIMTILPTSSFGHLRQRRDETD